MRNTGFQEKKEVFMERVGKWENREGIGTGKRGGVSEDGSDRGFEGFMGGG